MQSSLEGYQHPKRVVLLEKLQALSIAMLKDTTAAMSRRNREIKVASSEFAGGYLAFSGADVPLTRAVGVGTHGALNDQDIVAVEQFFRSRDCPVRIAISELTSPSLSQALKTRGYQSTAEMQNWWHPLLHVPSKAPSNDIHVSAATKDEAELWVRTVAAGFEEDTSAFDECKLSQISLDTFYCLGFANGAQPFLARRESKVVGGGVLHIHAETAHIRTTSCRLGSRGLGVQSALLAFRLDAALNAGCRLAFSSTDKTGSSSRNLERYGFRPLSVSSLMSS